MFDYTFKEENINCFVKEMHSRFFSVKAYLKGTLMQIWKPPYMSVFILKEYPENFVF